MHHNCESCGSELSFIRWSVDGSDDDVKENKVLSCRNDRCEKRSVEVTLSIESDAEMLNKRSAEYLEGNANTS